MTFNDEHNLQCIPMTMMEILNNPYHFKMTISPNKRIDLTKMAVSAMRLCATRCAGAQRWIRFSTYDWDCMKKVRVLLPFCQKKQLVFKNRLFIENKLFLKTSCFQT